MLVVVMTRQEVIIIPCVFLRVKTKAPLMFSEASPSLATKGM